ncbi:hypothetical protein [Mycobacterium sp. 155]|uniref:hypothetical protein n=1 Tax=Mycobacterium sp. 155 TaxID=1157943 RepID=UPI00038274F6|nr:hypothetical protein [Mycobacterium sp. 155]
MTVTLAFLIMASPFVVATALGWAAHRGGILRIQPDQFRTYAPMAGRLADYDTQRAEQDIDAVRTRFEQHPSWPSAGASGERR